MASRIRPTHVRGLQHLFMLLGLSLRLEPSCTFSRWGCGWAGVDLDEDIVAHAQERHGNYLDGKDRAGVTRGGAACRDLGPSPSIAFRALWTF
jgi:hypothetical protein